MRSKTLSSRTKRDQTSTWRSRATSSIEFVSTNPFPERVGQRDEQLLQRAGHRRPLRVRDAATSNCRIDAHLEEKSFTRKFVVRSGSGELFEVQCFADVVKHRADSHEAFVDHRAACAQMIEKRVGGFEHQTAVRDETLGSADFGE